MNDLTQELNDDERSDYDLAGFAKAQLAMRMWEREHIPFCSNSIAFNILLYAAAMGTANSIPCAKEFHLAIGCSKDRAREIIQSLCGDDWIRCIPNASDARMKQYAITARGIELLNDYRRHLCSLMKSNPARGAQAPQNGIR